MASGIFDPAKTAQEIGKRIGYTFSTSERLIPALTHVSAQNRPTTNYERLEFLGDRVLGLIVADMLFTEFPDADEGELSRRFNSLVNSDSCAAIADKIGLHEFIIAGPEMKGSRILQQQNMRADVVESLIAAIFLDGGLVAAGKFVQHFWQPMIHASDAARRDPKTELQEWAHRVSGNIPVYSTENRSGPDHKPIFTVKAHVDGFEPALGSGRSKREAEQNAATAILLREGIWAGTTDHK